MLEFLQPKNELTITSVEISGKLKSNSLTSLVLVQLGKSTRPAS